MPVDTRNEKMPKTDQTSHKSVIAATIAAGLVMLASGLSYRVLAARLAAPATTQSITAEDVARFPLRIGEWEGKEVSMDEEIVRATDTDAHISRRYSRRNGTESVSLWVACGVQARDLMPHRPEVCYTGNGWMRTNKQSVDLSLDDGTMLPCNQMEFSRGVLNMQKVLVLYYYLVDGQYSRDVSLLRSKAWRGSGTVGYVAQVQIVANISAVETANSAAKLASSFALDSARQIAELFESHKPDEKLNQAGASSVPAEF